jgi:hypothetical protein
MSEKQGGLEMLLRPGDEEFVESAWRVTKDADSECHLNFLAKRSLLD